MSRKCGTNEGSIAGRNHNYIGGHEVDLGKSDQTWEKGRLCRFAVHEIRGKGPPAEPTQRQAISTAGLSTQEDGGSSFSSQVPGWQMPGLISGGCANVVRCEL